MQQLEGDMSNHKEQVEGLCATEVKLTSSGHFKAANISQIIRKLKERYILCCY